MCLELPNWSVRAGARETIYMDPEKVTAAIVTCGGLCPGLNDVVAGLVNKLTDYGVKEGNIIGIRYVPVQSVSFEAGVIEVELHPQIAV